MHEKEEKRNGRNEKEMSLQIQDGNLFIQGSG